MPTGFFESLTAPRKGRFSLEQALGGSAAALLLLSWLVTEHFLPWVSWHSEVLAFLSVFFLALGFWAFPPHRNLTKRVNVPGAGFLFVTLGGVVAIQTATGLLTFLGDALVLELYLTLCVVALTLGFLWGEATQIDPQGSRKPPVADVLQTVAWTLVAGAVASALIALVQVFDVWDGSAWVVRMPAIRRPGGNLGQPNQLATLLLMGIASLLYLRERTKLSVATTLLSFVVLSTGLAATESRTGLLSFLLLCAWCFTGRFRTGLSLSLRDVGLATAGSLSLFMAWPSLMSSSGAFATGAVVDGRAGLRLVVWPQLFEAIEMRPWWGWGLREVSEAHNAVASNYSLSEPYTYSHNVVLDLALGMGLPLTGLAVLVVGIWLWRRFRSTRSLTPWYCMAAILPVAVHSMLEFPFAYAYFLVPALFLIGVLEATSGAKPVLRLDKKLVSAGLLVVTFVGCWSVVEYLMIEEDFRVARFEALRIGQTSAEHRRPQVHLLTQLDALLQGARTVPRPGMSPDEVELARKVALRYPWPATQNRYALSLSLNGNPDEALRQMRVIRALHGENTYSQIKANWEALATEKYQALSQLTLP